MKKIIYALLTFSLFIIGCGKARKVQIGTCDIARAKPKSLDPAMYNSIQI